MRKSWALRLLGFFLVVPEVKEPIKPVDTGKREGESKEEDRKKLKKENSVESTGSNATASPDKKSVSLTRTPCKCTKKKL